MDDVRKLISRILNLKFPSPGGKEIAGIDLVLLDSDIMGLGDSFLKKKGMLTSEKLKVLGDCKNDLSIILPLLDQSERQYFGLLDELVVSMINLSTRS